MFKIEKKCNNYETILGWQKALSVARIVVLSLNFAALPFFLVGVNEFLNDSPDLLMLGLISTIIINIFGVLLRELFKENNNRIIFSYLFNYGFVYFENVELIHLLYDDKNAITPRIKYGLFSEDASTNLKITDEPYSGMLLVQLSKDKKALEFISMGFLALRDYTYCTKKYIKYVRHDFGKLLIPIDAIHHYEQLETQSCNLYLGKQPNQYRLTFVGVDALDRTIPWLKVKNTY